MSLRKKGDFAHLIEGGLRGALPPFVKHAGIPTAKAGENMLAHGAVQIVVLAAHIAHSEQLRNLAFVVTARKTTISEIIRMDIMC